MPFGIPSEGFWSKKELAYQHVHMFWSMFITLLFFKATGELTVVLFTGFVLGSMMESYQAVIKLIKEKPEGSRIDAVRDIIFWWIGGMLAYPVIIFF